MKRARGSGGLDQAAVFITGAARGIGLACARAFVEAGAHVGVCDRDGEALDAAAKELAGVHAERVDVCEPESVARALAAFVDGPGRGRLDVLVNNAGVMHVGPFEAVPLAAHHQTIAVNFQGLLNLCHAAFPHLAQTPGARLINMSSASAIHGIPEMASYSATKHAVRGLTEALAIEWARHDVRVCDVMPMFVRTRLLTNTARLTSEGILGVHLSAADVAAVVLTAARSDSRRVHWPVGFQSKLAHQARGFAPDRLTAFVLRRLAQM
ncbi:short-chain dehydrogenase/reductase SDR [Plesiocystis pacifica SIR-1]|uniref:Short-chain dehydrogenase/reductase SDR n=1 Tax=Plesiocystis pacifica SIR-1 TaxID=391625 RepID=A6FXI4_9BACT|nr:SDR family oxidoreductase [Plesiocystis pacifica]EDM81572.1 short-chain dehydrogenase/reductase SDR [Plesiocystis pacifica SIR-1]